MRAKILGIAVKQNKEGQISTTIYGSSDFSDWDRNNSISVSGQKIFQEWTRLNLNHINVGDEVNIEYGKLSNGDAILEAIVPVDNVEL